MLKSNDCTPTAISSSSSDEEVNHLHLPQKMILWHSRTLSMSVTLDVPLEEVQEKSCKLLNILHSSIPGRLAMPINQTVTALKRCVVYTTINTGHIKTSRHRRYKVFSKGFGYFCFPSRDRIACSNRCPGKVKTGTCQIHIRTDGLEEAQPPDACD